MPAVESQIRDTLHKTLQDLQMYNRGTPQTESEKLFFLTDVSISVDHRAEQGDNFRWVFFSPTVDKTSAWITMGSLWYPSFQ